MPLTKGQTNNPRGRPRKNRTLTEILAKYANTRIADNREPEVKSEYDGMKARDALVKMMWQKAIYEKDMVAAKYIFDRIDGKPVETLRAEIDRGDVPLFRALQKDLFDSEELEGGQDAGTLEPPEETGGRAPE
jgi:hypothetical protein